MISFLGFSVAEAAVVLVSEVQFLICLEAEGVEVDVDERGATTLYIR